MYAYPNGMYRETANPALSTVTLVDPYFYHTLRSLQGKPVVIETFRGPVRGTITDVKPDHVLLQTDNSSFFLRTQQMIWVMPS
ncbi:hypothetical protein C7121_06435 [Paenibacillus glucanolyticus]|uniref:DUF2642 domain-containing protein n=4 Tax=Paenibacillaceae TaxID=186822 RepID=A0A7X2ZEJ1_9BACL|nr:MULTISPECIES: YuzF family protein [Paenibacillus]AVV55800.1 hypothetical protein C7121_06435 [Paenibacillus glucanolyticus]MUG72860.1 DUF2642 domain-containing protein [Paenibacillus validus]QGG58482.1 DUF2642 domain-containing protein [Paenibacillus sp. B01]RRJ62973.1 DUF2642 domain-containing protein [Paenibacillus oralis]